LSLSNNYEPGLLTVPVYEELRRLAATYLRSEPIGQTLTGTALVHEAFLRIQSRETKAWNDARHYFATAALTMRRILVDRARQKKSLRRGGEFRKIPFESIFSSLQTAEERSNFLTELDRAITKFAEHHPAAAELVNLWYFGGLTMTQAAGILGISRSTAHRHWQFAKAWLACEIKADDVSVQRRS